MAASALQRRALASLNDIAYKLRAIVSHKRPDTIVSDAVAAELKALVAESKARGRTLD